MRNEDEIKKEIEKLNKEIDKNSSPLYGLTLVERKKIHFFGYWMNYGKNDYYRRITNE